MTQGTLGQTVCAVAASEEHPVRRRNSAYFRIGLQRFSPAGETIRGTLMSTFKKSSLLAGTFIAGAMIASPAFAQTTDDSTTEPGFEAAPDDSIGAPIVVTGSRIQRRNVETAAPIAVVNAEEFELSGTVNVENVINTLPQVIPGTTSFSNNPGNGAATLNLRGLGAARTLVLVNGRRYLSYDTNQIVDLNTIPSFLVESVDVVTGGASAVYGSDALAGVVNFRLKRLEGLEIGGQYNITERGDGARYNINGAIGSSFDDGRGNATVYAEYFNREAIFQGDRGFSNFALGGSQANGTLSQGGSSLPPETRLTYLGDGDTTGTAFDTNGLAIFGTPGTLRPFQSPGDLYNYAPANYLQLPQERYLFGGYADYEISDGHSVFGEVTYVNNRVAAELAPTPILVNIGLPIDRAAPFLSDETIADLRALDASEESTLQVATAAVSGTFGDFAIGDSTPVGFALGGEYRKVSANYTPDEFLSSGDVQGFNAGQPTGGSYDVKELFGELNVPIEFGSARLELNGAARYSDYSLDAVGGVFTYAGGVQFAPIPDVVFRGQYQRAIRAPNIAELYQGLAVNFPSALDPCADEDINASTAAFCILAGVPEANIGEGAQGPGDLQPDTQIQSQLGGNPALQEETSESFTFGVVLQPSFVRGLTITADYFDVKIEDAISTLALQTALDLCFIQAQDLNSPLCANFIGIRDETTGAFNRINPPQQIGANIAEIGVSGIDLEVSYDSSLPFSFFTDTGEQRVNLSFLGTWTESSTFSPVQGGDQTFECSGFFAGNCGQPTPEFKWVSRASFIDGPVTSSLRWRHLDGVDGEGIRAAERISSYDLLDVTFSFRAADALTLTVGVNNVFDTLPDTPRFDAAGNVINNVNNLLQGDAQEQANTYPSTYDVLGRDFFVSAAFRF
ncbi:TonB-dependent receptor domain-containing protein [Erythrobacter litoralis]|uniref:TonB-dependent receptor domain-containing protein n=1 Tax=Erythrobacter litoralis TaxID=39960 RepID=UPI002435FDFE|nr:TonB-dependent receptor [Erythrobacter litoralis]